MQVKDEELMKKLIKQFIYQGYATKEFEKFQKTWLFRTLTPTEHNDIVTYVNFTFANPITKQNEYERLVLKKALISINGVEIEESNKEALFDKLAVSVFDEIYKEYHELEKLQNEALLHEELIKKFAEPSFDRIKFLVMQQVNALPTEKRVQDMNDYQWLWYWYNMQKKVTEDEELEKAKRDYLCMFINPELWKKIKDNEGMYSNRSNASLSPNNMTPQNVVYGDTTIDEDFDMKIAHMLRGQDAEFDVLPGSNEKGDASESQSDFITRVMNNQKYVEQENERLAKQRKQEQDMDMIIPVE